MSQYTAKFSIKNETTPRFNFEDNDHQLRVSTKVARDYNFFNGTLSEKNADIQLSFLLLYRNI